jgi:hypothetical protein
MAKAVLNKNPVANLIVQDATRYYQRTQPQPPGLLRQAKAHTAHAGHKQYDAAM